ncbi:DMT family transporter [Tabrizicola sp.]|uniref:DMT family transporter n=1 Tax=Tabrizicola sp. TaxID=2005166 RepID=UPI00286A674B|nr:DMT family transporter [Tabrizicola sp.]
MPKQSNLIGALLGLLAMGLFAASDITIKALGSSYNPFQIIFFAGLMSVPLIAGLAMADPTAAPLRPVQPRLMALRCIVVLVNGIFGTYAFATLPLAQAYAIFFTMPIFVTFLSAVLLGERIDLPRGMAVLAGLVGVIVALDPGRATLQWGHAAALAGAVVGAGNYVIIRVSGTQERTVVMILYPLMLQLLVAALVLPFVYTPMPFGDLALTALMATVSFAGYLAIISAYRRAPGIVVAPMQYSQIIWAAIFGALLFDEAMSAQTILGVAVIILAGIVIVARQDKAA